MTTKTDITLPPLPKASHTAGYLAGAPRLYKEELVEEYARAAVEADRQDHLRDATKMVPSDEEIRQVFLDHGFTTKPGCDDLKPYVYAAARALLSRYSSGQPAASADPCEGSCRLENGGQRCSDCGYVARFPLVDPVYAAPVAQEPVAYLDIGAGGYMDVGTDLTDEQLAALPKGRHMLAIVGTHGVDGFTAASVAAQAQPVVNQQMTTEQTLANTQRAIIEAAERRGYARGVDECAQDREDGK